MKSKYGIDSLKRKKSALTVCTWSCSPRRETFFFSISKRPGSISTDVTFEKYLANDIVFQLRHKPWRIVEYTH